MGTSVSLRERKKARLRLDLTRAAVDLSRTQGFDATTVEQIAAHVETSPRTFFRYFRTKEDVLFGDTPDRLDELRELLNAADQEPPIAVVRRALGEQIQKFTAFDDPELESACARLWVSEPGPRRRYIEIVLEWEAVIAEYLARRWRRPSDDAECRLVAMALIAAVRVSLEQGGGGLPLAEGALRDGFSLLEAGVRDPQPDPG